MNISVQDKLQEYLDDITLKTHEKIIFAIVIPIVAACGAFGNILVVAAILGSKEMRNSQMNFFLCNLAVADLGNLLLTSCDWIQILIYSSPYWELPSLFCPLVRLFQRGFLYVSVLFQIAVALERFFAIACPLRVSILCTKKRTAGWSILLWLFGIAFSSPIPAYYRKYKLMPTYFPVSICAPLPRLPVLFQISEMLLFYFLPLFLFGSVYTAISFVLRKSSKYALQNVPEACRGVAASRSIKERREVVVMLALSVLVYFLCFSPLQLSNIASLLGSPMRVPFWSEVFFNLLCVTSSASNPLFYSIFSKRFRARFAWMLCRRKLTGLSRRETNNAFTDFQSRKTSIQATMLTGRQTPMSTFLNGKKEKTEGSLDSLLSPRDRSPRPLSHLAYQGPANAFESASLTSTVTRV